MRSFLARHGIVTNNKIKVEEYCIKPKNSLFLLGTLGENPGIEVSPQPVRDDETSTPSTRCILTVANPSSFSWAPATRTSRIDLPSSAARSTNATLIPIN